MALAIDGILPDLPKHTLISHVPTANQRVRMRGYDQAKLIATALAKKRALAHKTLLLRRGKARQVGAGRTDRFSHLENAFLPIRLDKIKDAEILLIDDVTTTGATLQSAAKTLKSAGAKTIYAAVFAQPLS